MIEVIVNPSAGNGRSKRIGEQIEARLKALNIPYHLSMTEYSFHATELAKAAAANGASTVLSVGGDGTAFETASGLLGTSTALGIIPAGTGNDFIKSANIPKDPLAALDYALSHSPRPVDVGQLNERMFLNVCGVGFDVMVLEYSLKAKKYAQGILPYLYGVLRTIFTIKPIQITYTLDNDEKINASVLIFSVANGKFIGGGIPIAPPAAVDDGFLDVVIVKSIPRWKIPFYLPGLMMGKITQYKICKHIRCKHIFLTGTQLHINIDGEILPMNDVTFSALPSALQLHW